MDRDLVLTLKTIDPAELGGRIKRLRLQRGLTQGQLAAGVASTAYVSRIESGQRRPESDVLEGLARTLDVPARELLVGESTPLRARVQLELDYAELELKTGSAVRAAERLASLPASLDDDQRHTAALLGALADQAQGKDAIPALERLAAEDLTSAATWFGVQIALCRALRDAGEVDTAASVGEAALKQARERGLAGTDDGIQLAATLASIYELRGEIPRALRLAQTALAAADESISPRARAYVCWNASVCASEQGDVANALQYADQALLLLGVDGDARQRAMLRSNIGGFLLHLDDPDVNGALAALSQAVGELEMTGASTIELVLAKVEQARAHYMADQTAVALSILDPILAEPEALGPFALADALVIHGDIYLRSDPAEAAADYHRAVLALATTDQDRAVIRLWYQIAARFEEIGDAGAALDAYRRAGIASGALTGPQAAKLFA
ncbi:MAG: helix-turn-helix domain-containing protein [Nocardioides sp.]|uniref:helix-turn-helix domain-containing protein n=1 Tax=Nocardioides sp. TaxID=35761 RepID=UPI0039E462D8